MYSLKRVPVALTLPFLNQQQTSISVAERV